MMFQKINLNLGAIDIDRIKGPPAEKYGPSNTKLTHHTIQDMSYFIWLHTGKIKFAVLPNVVWYTEIEGTDLIPPHIDPLDTAALNYYIHTGACVTTFYKTPELIEYATTQQEFNVDDVDRTVKAVMDVSKLLVADSFRAENNDAYLIRPDMLHSVTAPEGTRKFLSYRWCGPTYDQVLSGITIL